MLLLCGLASAGELVVSSAVPVQVWVDGQYVANASAGAFARLSGMTGVHRVQVSTADNTVLLGETQVQMPWDGVRNVSFDGVNLVVSAPAMVPGVPQMPQVVVVPAPAPAPAPAPVGPTAMGPKAFDSLVAAVNSATYGDDKVNAIRTAAGKNWFTVDQVGRLIDGITYGSDQVAAVQALASKVVDPENAFSLSSHFTYSSDKEAALALFQ